MFSFRLLNISRSVVLIGTVLLSKYRSVPWGLIRGGQVPGARSDEKEKSKNR